jgi:hypothetical protein
MRFFSTMSIGFLMYIGINLKLFFWMASQPWFSFIPFMLFLAFLLSGSIFLAWLGMKAMDRDLRS